MHGDAIFAVLIECCREVIPDLDGRPIQRSDRLADLGANSIERAEIITLTLERLSLPIARAAVAGLPDLGRLADVLYERMHAS